MNRIQVRLNLQQDHTDILRLKSVTYVTLHMIYLEYPCIFVDDAV